MKRDYRDYIQDIISGIDDISEFTKGQTYDNFNKDKKTINAVIRCLEVIGEAAKKIPASLLTSILAERERPLRRSESEARSPDPLRGLTIFGCPRNEMEWGNWDPRMG